MQQKVQFISAVLHDPRLVILDEPFSGLDPVNVELLKEIVLELKAAEKTIIFRRTRWGWPKRSAMRFVSLTGQKNTVGELTRSQA